MFPQILPPHPAILADGTDGIESNYDIGDQVTVLFVIGDIHLLSLLQLLNCL
jgi:hypothetical protein